MFKNYIKITLRSLRKHKGYAVINISGLAVGMACCLLIVLFVRDELNMDRFHTEADRIYRLVMRIEMGNSDITTGTPLALAETLVEEKTTVSQAARLTYAKRIVVEQDDALFFEPRFYFADPAFFDVFAFALAQGNPETALVDPFTVVLDPAMAEKYFPNQNAVGESLIIDQETYTVTGILAPVPSTSHLQFNFIASLATELELNPEGDLWSPSGTNTYARLAQAATPEAFQKDLDDIAEVHLAKFDRRTLQKMRFTDIYFGANFTRGDGLHGSLEYIYIFSAIALLILLIACINYMNLATARASRYAKEVGVRKVVGAHRQQLIGRFLSESLFFSTVALFLAIGLVELVLPTFNQITGKALAVPYFDDRLLMSVWLIVGLSTGFFAGSYPAFFLSKFKPAVVLKGSIRAGASRAWLRKSLVVFQFAVTVIFFVGTLVVQAQLDFVQTERLGFNKEQIVVLPAHPNIRSQYATFKAETQQVAGVMGVTSAPMPSQGSLSPILLEGESEDAYRFQNTFLIDDDFLSIMDIELVHGRNVDADLATDLEGSVLLNEAAVRAFDWTDDPLNHTLERLGEGRELVTSQVVGVVRDFNYQSLKNEVEPLVLQLTGSRYHNMLIKVHPNNLRETLRGLSSLWQRFVPERPFEYTFLDERFAEFYESEQRLGRIFNYFSLLAILIACLGLFGLAAFTAEQRTKEIGIRKILGASVAGLVVLLSKDFVKLVTVAFILAVPLAYTAMSQWLDKFAYRVDLTSGVFLLAGIAALTIAVGTVSYQAIKAAFANPVDSLRYE